MLDDGQEVAHEQGSRIILQLAHAGIHAPTSLTHREAVGPSVLEIRCSKCTQTIRNLSQVWNRQSRFPRAKRSPNAWLAMGYEDVQQIAAKCFWVMLYKRYAQQDSNLRPAD